MNPIVQSLEKDNQKQTSNNPDALFNAMMSNNPKFRQFVNANAGKTVEQIALENGINIDMLKSMINK